MITNGTLTGLFPEEEISVPRQVRFWLFLILVIPSIYCSCVLLFQLFVNKKLQSQLSNHIIICLLIFGLIIELIDITLHLSFLQLGIVWPSAPALCTIWWLVDTGLYNGSVIIMTWGSIHRYLLIFHDRLFLIAKKRFLFHTMPLIILILYIFIFYIVVMIFPPCLNSYDYTSPVCGEFPCYFDVPLLSIWDTVINSIVPTAIITIFSIIVLARVYIQKRRLNRANLWRRQRKMTIQLLSICILFLVANVPFNFVTFAHICGLSSSFGADVQVYSDYLCYFVTLLFPFVCLSTLSEMRRKLRWKGLLLFRQPRHIATIHPK
ncbi:unnamed protein product [Adineta steineri]|uniref:G-protein coupled receptors family 1 profile domain-containing protein n=1 Tax=Adineta steineri TaxID=433720 RepID=A0A819BZF5_9BILA|nr:unnamed protein product [Adineta steineri]CAF0979701.1 unnamed protein product [Adineta steineri]CAF3799689.1 unnamed protein product [Adineta steineri]CAF4078402.1 unnamed protein product [Adineta steineri]